MLMAFLCLQNGGNSPKKKHWVASLILILIFFLNDKAYNDMKDWTQKVLK